MVASTRVQNLTQGFDFVTILADFIKDPKLIKSLEEEVVKINTFNAEQTAQYDEAIQIMQQRDSLLKEISELRRTYADEKKAQETENAARQEACDSYVAKAEAKIEKANQDLDKREAALAEYATRLDQRENLLKEKASVVHGLFGE